MAKNETFLSNVNIEEVTSLMSETENNVEYFNTVSTNTANRYTEELDSIMDRIRDKIKSPNDCTNEFLEKAFLELSNAVYYMGEKLEQLSIRGDMAKASEKEVYNKAYLGNQVKDGDKKNKTTVAENQAVAENKSQYEAVVYSIYDHAYKIVKFKVDSARDMVTSIKKIISKRMQDEQLSNMMTNGVKYNSSNQVDADEDYFN